MFPAIASHVFVLIPQNGYPWALCCQIEVSKHPEFSGRGLPLQEHQVALSGYMLGILFDTSEQGINDRLHENLWLVQVAGFHQIVVNQFAADWSVFTVFNLRDANKVMLSQQINCIVL